MKSLLLERLKTDVNLGESKEIFTSKKRIETRGFANRLPCGIKLNYKNEARRDRVEAFKALLLHTDTIQHTHTQWQPLFLAQLHHNTDH